uniref:Uncharacterized protein n=1 Tax=Rhizophora mucronata TaxID=61149 RepID=A0A2P2NFA1_RHIMU
MSCLPWKFTHKSFRQAVMS